jgi:hypothetical protein
MGAKPLWAHVVADEALTRGLSDPEARVLVEWLVDRAESLSHDAPAEAWAWEEMQRLSRRARAISRFVHLWCYDQRPGAAGQLAVAEAFTWPLPVGCVDPCELMQNILGWESGLLQSA